MSDNPYKVVPQLSDPRPAEVAPLSSTVSVEIVQPVFGVTPVLVDIPIAGREKETVAIQPLVVDSSTDNQEPEKYDGDRVDVTPPLEGEWKTIPFGSPLELAYYFDTNLNTGRETLHKWQIEILEECAAKQYTDGDPYRFCLCAANGSGKDKYVIAPFVVWFALTNIRALVVITSASGTQLTAQTENYISSLCRAVNAHYGTIIFKITRRFIRCLKSGSEIRMFATDEAGKAEGYHPLEPGTQMAIIVNEAKNVSPEIFGALSRCTGYSHWWNVSSPGEPNNLDFHDSFVNWSNKRRVTAFECPHLKQNHIDEIIRKHGTHSAIYRSQVLALFTTVGGTVVIDQDKLNKCIELSLKGIIKPVAGKRKKIGIDLAAGRDECAHVCINGNYIEDDDFYHEPDTVETEQRCEKFCRKQGPIENNDFFADDGGLGHAIIDRMVRRKLPITRVLNQSRAYDSTQFGNRGAEMWYNVARLIEECVLYLPLEPLKDEKHKKLYEQLTQRFYKKNPSTGKITLESKEEARAVGHMSPDRADAYVLALCDTTIDTVPKAKVESIVDPDLLTYEQIQQQRWQSYRDAIIGNSKKPEPLSNNSLLSLMAARHDI